MRVHIVKTANLCSHSGNTMSSSCLFSGIYYKAAVVLLQKTPGCGFVTSDESYHLLALKFFLCKMKRFE